MMKIAFVADAHLIAQNDPYTDLHHKRAFFKHAWPSFISLLDRLNDESPDLVVFLGDLVDWFSPQNVEFALELVGRLKVPWTMTLGNHDVQVPNAAELSIAGDGIDPIAGARDYWAAHGCDARSRKFTDSGLNLLIFDSALSRVETDTVAWLDRALTDEGVNLVATHVPVDIEPVRQWITRTAPQKNLQKYVQSGTPYLYGQCLRGRVAHVFTGHLHLNGRLNYEHTSFHLLDMSISTHDTNRRRNHVAEATIVESECGGLSLRRVRLM